MNGRRDQLEGKIQERYGIAKDQAKKDVDNWFNSLKWWWERSTPKTRYVKDSNLSRDSATLRCQALAPCPWRKENVMSVGTILLIILVIALLGGFSGFGGGPFYGTGYYGGGGLGLILVIVLILVLLGKLWNRDKISFLPVQGYVRDAQLFEDNAGVGRF
jgi:hypothetical protein